MKAKLVKNELPSGYFLYDEKGDLIASTIKGYNKQPLSLKNCQSIERGYDLDELANKANGYLYYDSKKEHKALAFDDGYRVGFQKALSILGDKKFSEEDMLKAFITGVFTDETSDHDFEFTELMKDLQQTEWEVEIVEEYRKVLVNGYKNQPTNTIGFVAKYENQLLPKLDADGCLILRKI